MTGTIEIPFAVLGVKEKATQLIELHGFYWRPLGDFVLTPENLITKYYHIVK